MSKSPPLTTSLLINAYSAGVFPMGSESDEEQVYWIDPPVRGIFPLDAFRTSKSLRKTFRKNEYDVVVNRDFLGVMRDCANRDQTWINSAILRAYGDLHERGFAHSVEVLSNGDRVGGLYGVCLGGAFFGESMFSSAPDASKIALIHLVARLRFGGFQLLDTQFTTEHLTTMGAVDVAREQYQKMLREALPIQASFYKMPETLTPPEILEIALA